MAFGTRVRFDEVREDIFSGVTANFTPLGSPTTDNGRILILNSSLDEPIYISFDGSTNQIRMFPTSVKIFQFCANEVRDDGLFLAIQTQISIKAVSTLPTTGAVWAEIIYGEGGK